MKSRPSRARKHGQVAEREGGYKSAKTYRSLVGFLHQSLIRVLGREVTLIVELSLDTEIALSQPLAYFLALEDLVGRRASQVLLKTETRTRRLGVVRRLSDSTDLLSALRYLRPRYDAETLERYK